MKATIDIPDELYRKVKAKSALEGRTIRDVAIELFRQWTATPPGNVSSREGGAPSAAEKSWVDELLAHAVPANLTGPSAREILEADRHRLERRR